MTTLSSSGADRPAASPPRRVRQALSQILGVVGASEGREIARRGRSGHRELFLPNQAQQQTGAAYRLPDSIGDIM